MNTCVCVFMSMCLLYMRVYVFGTRASMENREKHHPVPLIQRVVRLHLSFSLLLPMGIYVIRTTSFILILLTTVVIGVCTWYNKLIIQLPSNHVFYWTDSSMQR